MKIANICGFIDIKLELPNHAKTLLMNGLNNHFLHLFVLCNALLLKKIAGFIKLLACYSVIDVFASANIKQNERAFMKTAT